MKPINSKIVDLPRRKKPGAFQMRQPSGHDGLAVNRLIGYCQPLDTNSIYCNLLQCTHFSTTSVIALQSGEVCGFVSGYLKPLDPQVLFVWQVAVAEEARGRGLGLSMVKELLNRPVCAEVKFIETSINPDNQPSWSLFESLARQYDATLLSKCWFDSDRHFNGQHEDELLVRIGPFEAQQIQDASQQHPRRKS